MDTSSILMIALVLVALAVSLVTFGLLRERGRRTYVAGCASIIAGLFVIFVFVMISVLRILF